VTSMGKTAEGDGGGYDEGTRVKRNEISLDFRH
jgi:hypothetical protein